MQNTFSFHDNKEQFPIVDGELFFYANFLSSSQSDKLFNQLVELSDWEQGSIRIFGKNHLEPRLRCWYGEKDYVYSNQLLKAKPIPKYLADIQKKIEAITGGKFNSVLVNYYRNGNDSMGWHQDNEKELGLNPTIASLNIGETRIFHLKHIENSKQKIKIPLTNGSLLLMQGELQTYWKHQIPKTKKNIGARINLTFRKII